MAALQAWQAREFIYLALCAFILGMIAATAWGFAPGWLLPLAVAAALVLIVSLLIRIPALLYIVFWLLGMMWSGLDLLQVASFAIPPGEAVFFSGTVVEVAAEEQNYFAQLAEFTSDAPTFVMRGRDSHGWRGRLMIIGSPVAVKPGDKLELAAIVREFTQTDNFNLVNNDYLLNNGIGAVAMAVPQSMSFRHFASPYTPLNLGAAVKARVYQAMTALPVMQQALLKGIGFGETGMLTNGKTAVLQQTGIMHIFAVSGLHIAYVTMLAGALCEIIRKRLRLGYKFVIIGSMAVVVAFCLVVGFSPSILRAAIMSIAALFSVLLLREHTAGHALIVAAFLLLLYQPRWLCQPGFIMSFLATAGIIYTADYWYMLIPNKALAVSFAAQFMVIPVVAYFYNTISLIGLLISPFIALGAGVVVILILLAMPLSLVGLGLVPLAGAGLAAQLLYDLAELFAGLPGAFTYTMRPGLGVIVVYYLLLLAAYFILARCRYERGIEGAAKELPQGEAEL